MLLVVSTWFEKSRKLKPEYDSKEFFRFFALCLCTLESDFWCCLDIIALCAQTTTNLTPLIAYHYFSTQREWTKHLYFIQLMHHMVQNIFLSFNTYAIEMQIEIFTVCCIFHEIFSQWIFGHLIFHTEMFLFVWHSKWISFLLSELFAASETPKKSAIEIEYSLKVPIYRFDRKMVGMKKFLIFFFSEKGIKFTLLGVLNQWEDLLFSSK